MDEAALVCVVYKIEEREHGLIRLAVAVIGKRCTLVGYAVVEGVRFNVAVDTEADAHYVVKEFLPEAPNETVACASVVVKGEAEAV